MQKIPLKYAFEGMILGKPVTRDDGMVMAGEGLTLTESIIDRLKNSGINSVTVKGRPVPGLDSGDVDLAKMKERLGHLFRKYQQNPLMWTLRNMLEQYLERAIALQEEAARQERSADIVGEEPQQQQ